MSIPSLGRAFAQGLRRLLHLLPALAVVGLSACGGSDDAQYAHVRLLNASPGYDSLDLYLGDDRQAAAIATGAVSSYADVDPDTYDTSVRRAFEDQLARSRDLAERANSSKSRPWRVRPCTHTMTCAACAWPHCQ